jgi:hypothetical protein
VLARGLPVECVDRLEHEVTARAQALRLAWRRLGARNRASLLLLLWLLLLGWRDALMLVLLRAWFALLLLLLLWPAHALLQALKLQEDAASDTAPRRQNTVLISKCDKHSRCERRRAVLQVKHACTSQSQGITSMHHCDNWHGSIVNVCDSSCTTGNLRDCNCWKCLQPQSGGSMSSSSSSPYLMTWSDR